MTNQKPSIAAVSTKILGREMLIMLGMLVLISGIVFYKFIFGYAVYLFKDIGSDTLNTFYPAYINITETLWRGEFPGWSFEQGLGQNVFPFSLSDPTTYPLYLLGSNNLIFGIFWVELFKIMGSGLLFFSFLKKLTVDTRAAYMGGLLYAFSGFMIIGSGWYIFSTLGLYVALTLLSFEMLYVEKKWWLFPVSIALLAAFNVVNLYTCSAFLFLYVLFRAFSDEAGNFKQLTKLLISMVLLGALGILISSVFSLPNLMQMLSSPRVSGGASYASTLAAASAFELGGGSYLLTLLMRTFSSDLLGNGIDYKGWGNYLEAPLSYCGLIALLLVPQLFGFLRTRQRIVYATFLGIFIFAEIFPWFRQGFWLFQGDYFRDFSLYTAIIFILFSVFAFDRLIKGQKVNYLILCVSIFTLIILLYFPYEIYLQSSLGNTNLFELAVNHNLQIKILLFLVLLATSLILFNNEKLGKYAALCILIITSIELASFNDDTINSIENSRESLASEELSQRVGYNDYSIEALTFIKKQERSFYRIEKNYGSSPVAQLSLNDSKAQHYFGSSSYHSFNQLNYINFLSACGVLDAKYEDQSRWSSGVRNAPLSQVLVGIKYLLIKDDGNLPLWLENLYSKVGKFRDVDVLKAKYSLPLGVAYDTYITQSDFSVLDESRKGIALLKAIMIPDALAKNLPTMAKITGDGISENTYGIDDIALDTDKLKASSLRMKSFTNNSIDGEITVSAKQLLFLSFPYDEGWSATLNGKAVEMIMVDGGLSAISIEPGNNVIALRYFPPFVKTGFFLTLLGFVIFLALIFWSRRLTSQGDSLKLASWLSGKA